MKEITPLRRNHSEMVRNGGILCTSTMIKQSSWPIPFQRNYAIFILSGDIRMAIFLYLSSFSAMPLYHSSDANTWIDYIPMIWLCVNSIVWVIYRTNASNPLQQLGSEHLMRYDSFLRENFTVPYFHPQIIQFRTTTRL